MKSKNKRRNLETFINELLDVTNTRSKKERYMLELYNIKQIFFRSRSNISAIQSAMLRLAYIAMTGKRIDFGLDKIILLLNSGKFKNIQIGWLAFVIFDITDEVSLRSIIQILQQQLLSYDNEPIQCLALSVVSQVFSKVILEVVGPEVAQIAVSPKTSEFARKKALILSGKIYQISREPHLISVLAPALSVYLGYGSYSIRMATATLTENLMSVQPGSFSDVFDNVLDQLYQLYNTTSNNTMGFTAENNDNENASNTVINEDYEGTPSPWYSRQLIRILRYKASWNYQELSKINAVAMAIFSRTGEKLSIRPALAYFIVFSEMASLLPMIPIPENTIVRCAKTLARYLQNDRSTMIYFALNSLNRLFHTNPLIASSISDSLEVLYKLIHTDDSQVCMNSLNLLVKISTEENSKEIVGKLIQFLPNSPLSIRHHLCSIISMLAKKANDPIFYVDTIIELLFEEGDECDDSTWKTAVALLEDNEDLQKHTIELTLNLMKKTLRPSEQLMKLTVYVSGEYVSEKVNLIVSFIQARFALQSEIVQAMMVTAMAKICSRFPAFLNQCQNFLRYCTASPLIEVSDRAKQCSTMLDVIPFVVHRLMKRMPCDMGEDALNRMLETVHGVARGDEEGVLTFNFDENESPMEQIEPNEQLIRNFLLFGTGYVYNDMFLRVHLELEYKPPLVTAILSFENAEMLPLTEITAKIVTCEEILYKAEQMPHFIEQKSVTDFKVDFLLVSVTSAFPQISVAFKCGGIDHVSIVVIPIAFQRVMQSVKINPQSFKTQWSSLSNPNLAAEVLLPIASLSSAYINEDMQLENTNFNQNMNENLNPNHNLNESINSNHSLSENVNSNHSLSESINSGHSLNENVNYDQNLNGNLNKLNESRNSDENVNSDQSLNRNLNKLNEGRNSDENVNSDQSLNGSLSKLNEGRNSDENVNSDQSLNGNLSKLNERRNSDENVNSDQSLNEDMEYDHNSNENMNSGNDADENASMNLNARGFGAKLNLLEIAKSEIEMMLRSRLGLEPNYDLELPEGFIGGCGVYRVRKAPVVLMVIVEYSPAKCPTAAICRVRSNSEKGLVVAIQQLIPQQQEMGQVQPMMQNEQMGPVVPFGANLQPQLQAV